MDKKNNAAARFRSVRETLGLTQQGLADRLFVSRNYIAKIESGLKEPSVRLLTALEAARLDKGSREQHADPSVNEAATTYGSTPVESLKQQIREHFERSLAEAGDDLGRLGWMLEQTKEHLAPPKNWQHAGPQMVRVTLPSQTQALSTETGKPIPEASRKTRSA